MRGTNGGPVIFMPIINFKQPKITTAQLKYLELLVDRLEDRTWKISKMPHLLGNKKYYFSDLTKDEATIVIKAIKITLGDVD